MCIRDRSGVVRETARIYVGAFQGRGASRMVRLPEPPRRGAAAAQGRKMEGLQIHEVHTVFGTRGSHLRTNTAGSTEVDTDGSDLGRLTVVLLLRTFGSSRKDVYKRQKYK